MNFFFLLPFVVGVCTVMQGALNKRLSDDWGLAWALMVTSIIVIVLSGVLLGSGAYGGKFNWGTLKWWYVLPGIFGFLIIFLIPISIAKIGALNSFLILISSQILVSGIWDRVVEGAELSWSRILGATLAVVGAWVATK